MTCYYKNSSGTDLDSLFTVNNSNAGSIGFKTSDGTDLGNRFASGSLGTNIGYKNSAGTDIGYLRGKVVAPSGSLSLATSGPTSTQLGTSGGYWMDADTYIDETPNYGNVLTITATFSGSSFSSIDWYVQYKTPSSNASYALYIFAGTSISHDKNGPTNHKYKVYKVSSYTDSGLVMSTTTNSATMKFASYLPYDTHYVKIKAVVKNSVGSTTIYSSEKSFK